MIEAKLRNCLELDYPNDKLEVIVGSDGSTDKTDEIAGGSSEHGIKLFRWDRRRGKVSILNQLIPQAKGEIVVLTDANTIFRSDAIKKPVHSFEDPCVGCICGELVFRNAEENGVGNFEGFYWRYEQFLKRMEGKQGTLLSANGGIYAIRKELFEPLPSDIIIEDFLIPMNILKRGYKVIYEPEAIAFEETAKTIAQEMERRIRIGAGDFQSLLLIWDMLNPLHGLACFAYFSHKVLRWLVPFLLILVFLYNLALVSQRQYLILFYFQCSFYLMALLGYLFSKLNIDLNFFKLLYYFFSINLALFFGFLRFLTNSQSVTWQKTER